MRTPSSRPEFARIGECTSARHGINAGDPMPFDSMDDIPAKVERLLIEQGIRIHPSSRMRRYMTYARLGQHPFI
jgi:hypothetical protein